MIVEGGTSKSNYPSHILIDWFVTETNECCYPTNGRFPNQRLTRTQALRALTIDAAFASFTEQLLGSLEPKKKADFVVLGVDIMRVEDEKLREAIIAQVNSPGGGEAEGRIVKATVIDGALVFGDLLVGDQESDC